MDTFNWTGFFASLAAGGLLGSILQQLVQWRRDRIQRETEDRRRVEDRHHALADRRTAQREARYIGLLGSVAGYSSALAELEDVLSIWLDFVAVIKANSQPEAVDEARASWRRLPLWAGQVFDRYEEARDELIHAVNAAVPIASSEARRLFELLEVHPQVPLLRTQVMDSDLADESVPSTKSKMVSQLANGPGAVRVIDKLRDTCEELDNCLRSELALD